MAIREIRTFNDEILYKKSRAVVEADGRIRELLDDMAETLHSIPGAGGLAACQIGVLKRLVVIDLGEGLLKLVNPELVSVRGTQVGPEGCLSFPGRWGTVKRPQWVEVRALDENGTPILIKAEDLLARCLCHEIDHLDGKVFPDLVIKWLE